MTKATTYHQIGQFIGHFQYAEEKINGIITLLAQADDEMIRILINDLSFAQRLKAADVALARTVDLHRDPDTKAKEEFHSLMTELSKLSERRNDLVHSQYSTWLNIEGQEGLIRENSRLRGKQGVREVTEEELLPESLTADIEQIEKALKELEAFRLRIIDWFD